MTFFSVTREGLLRLESLWNGFQKCQAEKNDIRHNKAFFRNVI